MRLPHSRSTSVLALLSLVALAACGQDPAMPMALVADGGYLVADGVETTPVAPTAVRTPAPPSLAEGRRIAPSGAVLSCPVAPPPGACDRCPTRACRQVRLSLSAPPGEAPWAMYCESGDIVEEARIACSCAGGSAAFCRHAAYDSAQGLYVLNVRFGGRVPPIGTRYRDADGLRASVDQPLHDWLAGVAGPEPVLRCDEPDREAIETRYAEDAQRVRMTGECL